MQFILQFSILAWLIGQAAYWLFMRDDQRDEIVFASCLNK